VREEPTLPREAGVGVAGGFGELARSWDVLVGVDGPRGESPELLDEARLATGTDFVGLCRDSRGGGGEIWPLVVRPSFLEAKGVGPLI
jgi:hypothetical protein